MIGELYLETPEADLYVERDIEGGVYLHLDFKAEEWTREVYREMQKSFVTALVRLSVESVREVYVILAKDDEQTIKFETRFGFRIERTSEEFVRMKLEI